MEKVHLEKAEERLKVAYIALEGEYLNTAISNCYYALFYFFQAVAGLPPQGRWHYGELLKVFVGDQLKKVVFLADELYTMKENVDHRGLLISRNHKSKVEEYAAKVKSLLLSYEFRRI